MKEVGIDPQRREYLERAIQELSEHDRHHLLIDVLGVEHIEAKFTECTRLQKEQGIRCRECEALGRRFGIS